MLVPLSNWRVPGSVDFNFPFFLSLFDLFFPPIHPRVPDAPRPPVSKESSNSGIIIIIIIIGENINLKRRFWQTPICYCVPFFFRQKKQKIRMLHLTICQPDHCGEEEESTNKGLLSSSSSSSTPTSLSPAIAAVFIHGVYPSLLEARSAIRAVAPTQTNTQTFVIDDLNRWTGCCCFVVLVIDVLFFKCFIDGVCIRFSLTGYMVCVCFSKKIDMDQTNHLTSFCYMASSSGTCRRSNHFRRYWRNRVCWKWKWITEPGGDIVNKKTCTAYKLMNEMRWV